MLEIIVLYVALRKESVDRNSKEKLSPMLRDVALRKESVDRNGSVTGSRLMVCVALRKESVDRNQQQAAHPPFGVGSLSARRAWIEMVKNAILYPSFPRRSPQGERG